MDRLLENVLSLLIRSGSLRVTTAGGRRLIFGDRTGAPVAVRFTSWRSQLGIIVDPELRLGEAFMDGTLILEHGSISDLLALAMSQPERPKSGWGAVRPLWLLGKATESQT